MNINPYIAFDGNGREALQYYCDTLGAELVSAMTFGEMPGEMDWITDENRHRLAHGEISLNGRTIYASDTPGFEPHGGFAGITIHLGFDTVDDARAMFDKLAADGEVQMPFEATFWAAGFGMLTDKYGVPWMVDASTASDS